MKSLIKKTIIIVVILGIGYLAYSMFFKKSEDGATLISGASGLGTRSLADTQALGSQITQALVQIESLTLDRSIFSDPLFESLDDKSQIIQPQPAGRKNPFAPLGDTSVNYTVEDLESDNISNLDIDDDSEDQNESEENVNNQVPLGDNIPEGL